MSTTPWETRILHLGLGRFHRAHQAVYYQKLAEMGDRRWGVTSFSMRSPEASDQMRAAHYRYPVLELGQGRERLTWIESIRGSGSVNLDRALLQWCFENPTTEIVTLTVTEKGYNRGRGGRYEASGAVGILGDGLAQRRQAKAGKLSVLSCDNLRGNGQRLAGAVEDYLREAGRGADADWVNDNVTFPSTMVDRIVPALSAEQTSAFELAHKLNDSHLVGTEFFSQWVVEDDFAGTRPPWEKVGVLFVPDVRPYEEIKLRLLNASHSLLAYEGLLRGHRYVHEAVKDPALRLALDRLHQREVIPLLHAPQIDLAGYCRDMLSRFENDRLPHSLQQIAMDGTQKLPQRIFSSIHEAWKKGTPMGTLLSVASAWSEYVWRALAPGSTVKLEDPLADDLRRLWDPDRARWGQNVLGLDFIPDELRGIMGPSLSAKTS